MIRDFAHRVSTRLGIKNVLKKALPDTLVDPFRTLLYYEMLTMETLKSDWNLIELKDFPELRDSAWCGLTSLAYQMVQWYKPKVIVELGTHMGLSALAMGIALRDLGEGGKLYAIDTWEGDPQAKFYSSEVYDTFLKRRSHVNLDDVIIPLKMTFDEALSHVPASIDMLHVDGLHTWDAVNHDFDTYGPRVRKGGIVMFHDVNTAYQDLRRFWKKVRRKHEHNTVLYSHGLGVIRM